MPPTLHALLAGAPLYGESVERDFYAHLALSWPPLVTGDRTGLYYLVGESWPMAELLMGAWRATARVIDKGRSSGVGHPGRWAMQTFHTQIATLWDELGRLLDMRPAVDLDFDRSCRFAAPLDELRGRLTFYCAGLGEGEAAQELADMTWQAVRDAVPSGEDVPDLYATAVGAKLLHGEVRLTWLPDHVLTDVVGQWRQHGRVALRGAMKGDEPARSLPSHVQAIVEAHKSPVDDGPSLMVLASTEHLPGSAKDGDKPGTSRSTPRAEWAPFAGRHWPLGRVGDLATARAELVAEFPYAADIVDAVLRDLAGRPHVYVRPVLLVGPPGSGKTRLARRIADVLGLGFQVYSASGASDASFISTSRQWSTGRASIPLQLLKRLQAASACIVIDEIDKVGSATTNGNLLDGLLPFLTDDAKRIFDAYVESQVDLSGVSYIATANDISALRRTHAALVDRFRVYSMLAPRREDLPVLIRGVMAEIRHERGLDADWLPGLDGEETELVEAHFTEGGSVRLVRRLVETVLASRELMAVRN